MNNEVLDSIKKILDSGAYAGFAAFSHYLYVYQKGNTVFRFSSLLIAVLLGIFCGNIVDVIIPDSLQYELFEIMDGFHLITINKTAISFIVGFMYKFFLDALEKYHLTFMGLIGKSNKTKKL